MRFADQVIRAMNVVNLVKAADIEPLPSLGKRLRYPVQDQSTLLDISR